MRRCEICHDELVEGDEPCVKRLVWVHGVGGSEDCGPLLLCVICASHHRGDGTGHREGCIRCREFTEAHRPVARRRVLHYRATQEVLEP